MELQVHKTQACLSHEALLRYVTHTLSDDMQATIEAHLASCLYCLARSVEVHRLADAARREMCAVVTPQLSDYLASHLPESENEVVRTHLLMCDDCLERYEELATDRMQDEWTRWVREAFSPAPSKVVRIDLARLKNFPALRPWLPVAPATLAAQPQAGTSHMVEEGLDCQVVEHAEFAITGLIALDPQDHLRVSLESPRYDLRHTRLSLCMETSTGTIEVRSAVTDHVGEADFGSIADLPRPERAEYILVIAELAERTVPSGEGNSPSLGEFRQAQAFFQACREALLQEYEGKYIAIMGTQIVDVDADFSALAARVYAQYGYGPIYMPKVTKEPVKISIPLPRLGKPRHEPTE